MCPRKEPMTCTPEPNVIAMTHACIFDISLLQTVGVHCRHGRGRTGTMLACYLVHVKDMAPERAVLTVRIQRPGESRTFKIPTDYSIKM